MVVVVVVVVVVVAFGYDWSLLRVRIFFSHHFSHLMFFFPLCFFHLGPVYKAWAVFVFFEELITS